MKYTLLLKTSGDEVATTVEKIKKLHLIPVKDIYELVVRETMSEEYEKILHTLILKAEARHLELKGFEVKIKMENGKYFSKPFEMHNNLKQLILYWQLTQTDFLISTLKLSRATLRSLDSVETRTLPFYRFKIKDIKVWMTRLSEEGNAPHTITTKISAITSAIKHLKQLCAKYDVDLKINNDWENVGEYKKGREPVNLQQKNLRQFVSYTEMISKIMPSTQIKYTIVALLIYKGVLLSSTPEDNEIANLQWSDFKGNTLHIRGKNERDITFDNKEMEYIKKLDRNNSSKFILSTSRRRSDKEKSTGKQEEPLKYWSIWYRLNQVAKAVGKSPRIIGERNLRISGLLSWISMELIRKYSTLDVSVPQRNEVITEGYIKFGYATRRAIEEAKGSLELYNRTGRTAQLMKQAARSEYQNQ